MPGAVAAPFWAFRVSERVERMNSMKEGKGVGPYEFMQSIFLFLGGVYSVFGRAPESVDAVFGSNSIFEDIWCWALSTGALITVVSLLWSGRRITAYTLEQVGQIMVTGTTVLYVIGLLTLPLHTRVVSAFYIGSIAACAVYRTFMLERLKRELIRIQRTIDGIP